MTFLQSPSASTLLPAYILAFGAFGACDYGAVDPQPAGAADAAPAGEGDDDGDDNQDPGDDGAGDDGADDGSPGADGGPDFVHLSFPIDPGTTHAEFGCSDCHGDLDKPDDPTLLVCTGCHTGSHDETAMVDRHGEGAGVGALFESSPSACVTCHPQAAVYTRSQHDNVIDESGHGSASCSACHIQQANLTPATFENTKCTPCHDGDGGGDD